MFDALISIGIIKGKNITGNKKLFEVLVFVNKKINIPKDRSPKFATRLNKIRFNIIEKLRLEKIK